MGTTMSTYKDKLEKFFTRHNVAPERRERAKELLERKLTVPVDYGLLALLASLVVTEGDSVTAKQVEEAGLLRLFRHAAAVRDPEVTKPPATPGPGDRDKL